MFHSFEFCSFCPDFVQLLQFGLWGGTPSKPRTAFTIEFLEVIHAIQIECHASLKSICEAFEVNNFGKITMSHASTKIYPVIIDAFEEYRYILYIRLYIYVCVYMYGVYIYLCVCVCTCILYVYAYI